MKIIQNFNASAIHLIDKSIFIFIFSCYFISGQNISEFEKVLRTIHELWYAPAINTNITDVQYLQNYYTFIQRWAPNMYINWQIIIYYRSFFPPSPSLCIHIFHLPFHSINFVIWSRPHILWTVVNCHIAHGRLMSHRLLSFKLLFSLWINTK